MWLGFKIKDVERREGWGGEALSMAATIHSFILDKLVATMIKNMYIELGDNYGWVKLLAVVCSDWVGCC